MSDAEKAAVVAALLGVTYSGTEKTRIDTYITMSGKEILNWLYINVGEIPEDVTTVPARYEQIQIQACIAGYNVSGAENQSSHSENGISRTFVYDNMLAYIHAHVVPYVGVVA